MSSLLRALLIIRVDEPCEFLILIRNTSNSNIKKVKKLQMSFNLKENSCHKIRRGKKLWQSRYIYLSNIETAIRKANSNLF